MVNSAINQQQWEYYGDRVGGLEHLYDFSIQLGMS